MNVCALCYIWTDQVVVLLFCPHGVLSFLHFHNFTNTVGKEPIYLWIQHTHTPVHAATGFYPSSAFVPPTQYCHISPCHMDLQTDKALVGVRVRVWETKSGSVEFRFRLIRQQQTSSIKSVSSDKHTHTASCLRRWEAANWQRAKEHTHGKHTYTHKDTPVRTHT